MNTQEALLTVDVFMVGHTLVASFSSTDKGFSVCLCVLINCWPSFAIENAE